MAEPCKDTINQGDVEQQLSTAPLQNSKNSRDDLLALCRDFSHKMQLVAKEVSTKEAAALVQMLSGLSRSALLLSNLEAAVTYRKLNVSVPPQPPGQTDEILPVYLDTSAMQMFHGPLSYFPGGDIAKNYSTIWGYTPADVGFFVWSYITPGARMQLLPDSEGPWYNIVLNDTGTPQLIHRKENKSGNKFEMKIRFDGKSLFLAPIKAVKFTDEEFGVRIVAAQRGNLRNKDTFLWSDETVDREVEPFPVHHD